jgi:hypothetical protein
MFAFAWLKRAGCAWGGMCDHMAGGEGGGGAAAVADVPSLAVRVVAGDGAYLEVIAYLLGHDFTNEFFRLKGADGG